MEKRKISSLGLRIISSLVMVPLVVGAVYFGNPYLFLLLLLTGAMLCWEWSSMIKSANPALYATIYTVCMVISVLFPLSLMWLIIILFAGILNNVHLKQDIVRKFQDPNQQEYGFQHQ